MTKTKNNLCMLVICATAALLTACQPSTSSPVDPINQTNICEAKELKQINGCQPGQKIVYLPNSWGNEQLPILFAAINCDLRYSVAHTNGAVVCIYQPIEQKK